MRNCYLGLIALLLIIAGCTDGNKNDPLPILGLHEYNEIERDGKTVIDTVFHSIPDFKFLNQDSSIINRNTFKDKIYVADFFFTSCPTICPTVKAQMLRVYDKFEDSDELLFISHSIDTKRDSVPVLHDYGSKLNINSKRWHLVTGERDDIYGIAREYFIAAEEDPNSPGGYTHSGGLVLVDKQYRIRGIYDGTEEEEVDELMKDLELLLTPKNE